MWPGGCPRGGAFYRRWRARYPRGRRRAPTPAHRFPVRCCVVPDGTARISTRPEERPRTSHDPSGLQQAALTGASLLVQFAGCSRRQSHTEHVPAWSTVKSAPSPGWNSSTRRPLIGVGKAAMKVAASWLQSRADARLAADRTGSCSARWAAL